MRRALELARRGLGRVRPNPLVGAVVVREGRIVGEGWHAELGGPHAEVVALAAAGDAARGATLYVTLEPCAHHGRTPPCTDAVIAAGIAEVVYAATDPNPAAGGGADRLHAAGVRLTAGIERDAARLLDPGFFHRHEGDSPFIALKLATSLDGRIAAAPGVRTDITGAAARREAHRLRSAHDAVLVGSGTALVDDPLLTVRDAPVGTPPVRVVLDSAARLPLTARLVRTVAEAPVVVVCADDADPARVEALCVAGVRVRRARRERLGLDLNDVARLLLEDDVHTILVEGGARVATALLDAGLVHRLYLFVAPSFIGRAGVAAFDLERVPPQEWRCTDVLRCGDDALMTVDRTSRER
jgi:diaminohydroxyphosphoribosylaminopyrimidine deaminase / 5-amino-6-(5-phosphoribosylamino)uracil reductase